MRSHWLPALLIWLIGAGNAYAAPISADPSAVCPIAAKAPSIDGKLDDACWQGSPAVHELSAHAGKPAVREATRVYLACDESSLYIAFRCSEPEMSKLKLGEKQKVWRNDSVEVLIDSDRDRRGYYQFVVAADGNRLQIANGAPGESPDYSWSAPWKCAAARSDGEWTAEIAIPMKTLGAKVRRGCAIRANFARNEKGIPEISSWMPRTGTFDNGLHMGDIFLGGRPQLRVDLQASGEIVDWTLNAKLVVDGVGKGLPVRASAFVVPGGCRARVKGTAASDGRATLPVRVDLPEEPACGIDIYAGVGDKPGQLIGSYSVTLPPAWPRTIGAALSKQPWGMVWEASATSKVMPGAGLPSGKTEAIRIACAKNEFEPFQIVLTPKTPLKGLRAAVSDLVGPARMPASVVSVRQVETVPVVRGTSPDCLPGDYPDPLVPFSTIDVPAGRNTALWFTVRVPSDARAGDYAGSVKVTADGIAPVTIPLRLRVWDFALPEVSRLRTAYACDYNTLCRWHGASSVDDKRKVADLVNRDFIEHRVAPINPLPFWTMDTETINGVVTADVVDYDIGASVYVPHLSAFNLPGAFMGRIDNDPPGSEQYNRLKAPFLRSLAAYLRSKGWLDKAYCYMYDEPDEPDYPKLVEEAKLWHEADPDLKVMLTEQPEEVLYGSVDIWSPVLDAYVRRICQARQKAGDEVWWYVCCGPHHPFPNNFIDYRAIDHRILHWMNWKYGVTGVLYWQTTFWQHNPYKDPMAISDGDGKDLGNGDGSLLYPAVKVPSESPLIVGPVDSIRWEMIREGIEDYDTLMILQDAVAAARARGDAKTAKIGQAALDSAASLVRSTADYEKDPAKLYAARAKVAEAIEGMRLTPELHR